MTVDHLNSKKRYLAETDYLKMPLIVRHGQNTITDLIVLNHHANIMNLYSSINPLIFV